MGDAGAERTDGPIVFPDDGGCFGCSASSPHGLHMRFRRRGDAVVAEHTVRAEFHGAPAVAHGGIVAVMLDEMSCVAAYALGGTRVVTGELSVRYRQPCPVEVPLALSARLLPGQHPRYLVIEAEVRRGDEVLAQSTGKFFPVADGPIAP
ncbi:MAG: PaaI family thioesterase [Candidatus Binatia bacterium]